MEPEVRTSQLRKLLGVGCSSFSYGTGDGTEEHVVIELPLRLRWVLGFPFALSGKFVRVVGDSVTGDCRGLSGPKRLCTTRLPQDDDNCRASCLPISSRTASD